jgi:gliding motility-associated-like protein
MYRSYLVTAGFMLLMFWAPKAHAQEVTTQGREFYLSFFMNSGSNGAQANHYLRLYISSTKATTGTITNPNTNYFSNFSVQANSVTVLTLPASECITVSNANPTNTVLRVLTNDTVSIYSINEKMYSSDASIVLPTPALGLTYRIFSYTVSTALSSYGQNSMAMIVAPYPNTHVEITPTVDLKGGNLAGSPFTINLDEGESYAIEASGAGDLSGTLIKSVGTCKKIAVYGGVGCATIPNSCSSCDLIYEQLLPVESWGRTFIYTPTMDRSFDIVRIMSHNTANVNINGTITTITAGSYITRNCPSDTFLKITSTQPVAVMGYSTGQTCGGNGDPSMYWVNTLDQKIRKAIFYSSPATSITKNYVNVMVRSQDINRVYLNNTKVNGFTAVAYDNSYSAARLEVDTGRNILMCDSGFTAYAYGYGSYESYSYNVGSSTYGINPFVTLANKYIAYKDSGIACYRSPTQFNVSYNYQAAGIKWFFGDGDSAMASDPVHTYMNAGIYNLRLLITRVGDCNNITDTFRAIVRVPPPLDVSYPADTLICRGSTINVQPKGSGGIPSNYQFKWSDNVMAAFRNYTLSADSTIRVVLSDGCTVGKDSTDIRVLVMPELTLQMRPDTLICTGQPVSIYANAKGGRSTSYHFQWDNGLDSGRVKTVSPLTTTTYMVELSDGCTSPKTAGYVTINVRPSPDVIARQDTFFCNGQGANLYATATGGDSNNYVFTWDQGIGVGNNIFRHPGVTTTYKVFVTDNCSAGADTGSVTFYVRTPLTLTVPSDTILCKGQSRRLYVSGTGGDSLYYSYLWDQGIGTGNNKTVSPDTTTTYEVILTDNCTAIPDSALITITVRTPLQAGARSDTTICAGQDVRLYATASGGYAAGHILSWDQNLDTGAVKIVAPLQTTSYLLTLSDNCTILPDTEEVIIFVRPALDVNVRNDTTICKGQPVLLYTNAAGGHAPNYAYSWDHGLGNLPSHHVSPAATTTYKVALSDNCTLKPDTGKVTITVRDALNLTPRPDTLVCIGQPVNLYANGTGGDPSGYTYTWDNALGSGQNKKVTPAATTQYRVIFSDNCSSEQDTAFVTVSTRSALKVNQRQDTTICNDQLVQVYAGGSGGYAAGYKFSWDQGLGQGASHLTMPAATTIYRVILSDDCTAKPDTAYVTIFVRPELQVSSRADTTICSGQSLKLFAEAMGGDTSGYLFSWNNGLPAGAVHTISPATTTTYRVILGNNCALESDTGYTTVTVRDPLEILPMADTTICKGQQAVLHATATGGLGSQINLSWDNGLGSGNYFTVDPVSSTVYKAILDDGGCSAINDTAFIKVIVRDALELVMPADTLICHGQSVELEASGRGGDTSAYQFSWDRNLGAGAAKKVSPLSNTTYTIILEDNCSSDPDTASVTVYVRDPLSVKPVSDTLICYGQTLLLQAEGLGGDSSQYIFSWDQGLGDGKVKSVSPLKDTKYKVVLADNCSSPNDSGFVNVKVRPALQVFARQYKKICFNDTIILNAEGKGGDVSNYAYSWEPAALNGNSIAITPAAAGTFTAKLNDGCSAEAKDTFSIDIEALPEPTFRADSVKCFPEEVQFSNSSKFEAGSGFYWEFGDGKSSVSRDPSHSFTSAGTYSPRLKIVSPLGCRDSILRQDYIKIYPKPVAAFTPFPVTTDILTPYIKFTNTSQGGSEYLWDFGDNSSSADLHSSHEYTDTGTYRVYLFVQNTSGCNDSISRKVRIQDVFRFYVPNSFTPNGDQLNDQFTAKGQGIRNYETRVYNRWGGLVFQSSDLQNPWNGGLFNQLPALEDGLYLYMIRAMDFEGKVHYFDGQVMLLK